MIPTNLPGFDQALGGLAGGITLIHMPRAQTGEVVHEWLQHEVQADVVPPAADMEAWEIAIKTALTRKLHDQSSAIVFLGNVQIVGLRWVSPVPWVNRLSKLVESYSGEVALVFTTTLHFDHPSIEILSRECNTVLAVERSALWRVRKHRGIAMDSAVHLWRTSPPPPEPPKPVTADRVVDALLRHPELAFEVQKHLKVAGEWTPRGLGIEVTTFVRHNSDGETIAKVWRDGDCWKTCIEKSHPTAEEAMTAEDASLIRDGWTLVGSKCLEAP